MEATFLQVMELMGISAYTIPQMLEMASRNRQIVRPGKLHKCTCIWTSSVHVNGGTLRGFFPYFSFIMGIFIDFILNLLDSFLGMLETNICFQYILILAHNLLNLN